MPRNPARPLKNPVPSSAAPFCLSMVSQGSLSPITALLKRALCLSLFCWQPALSALQKSHPVNTQSFKLSKQLRVKPFYVFMYLFSPCGFEESVSKVSFPRLVWALGIWCLICGPSVATLWGRAALSWTSTSSLAPQCTSRFFLCSKRLSCFLSFAPLFLLQQASFIFFFPLAGTVFGNGKTSDYLLLGNFVYTVSSAPFPASV